MKITALILAATVATATAVEFAPDVRVSDGETYVGVSATWRFGGKLAAVKPATKAVYVEEWAVTADASDTPQVIDARTEEVPLTPVEHVTGHFKRNAGRYLATAAAAVGYVAYRAVDGGGKGSSQRTSGDTYQVDSGGGDVNIINRSEGNTITTRTNEAE